MSQFKVGDICVGQNFIIDTHRNGAECEIVEGLETRFGHHPSTGISVGLCYMVRWAGEAQTFSVEPHKLRLKKPPTREIDTIVKWENCLWRPKSHELEAA